MEPGSRKGPYRPEFTGVLEDSIEGGLRHVLGQSGMQMVLSLCPLHTITADPAKFHEVLKDIFMESGAVVLEREIGRRLLENVGDGSGLRGSSQHWWLKKATSKARSPGRVSKEEKEVLRQFLALESLPKNHPFGMKAPPTPIDLTAARFAYAFKKGN